MGLVVQIALGVVLGVLILRNLELIFSLGVIALLGAVVLAFVGAVIYLASTRKTFGAVLLVISVYVIGTFCARRIGMWTGLGPRDVGVFVVILFLLVAATSVFWQLIYQWSAQANEPLLYLFFTPIVGVWGWFSYKAWRQWRNRKIGQPTSPAQADG